jgi:tRNA 2-selenouridine synthase
MAVTLTAIADLAPMGFDDIIDVRSPSEYAEDHLPGAINLPVLSDAERAEVGTVYKQVNPFTARKLGAALVARNAATHLLGPLADKPGGWRPLLYCWRGGQRSGSFTSILAQIGWRAEVLTGGYKTWRGLVVRAVHDHAFPAPVVVLDGNTGTAKTEVLNLLPALGVQVLDLEGIARHRGSLFGGMGGQPSQKGFENQLAMAIAALDPSRPVVIEAESAKVGDCRLPGPLWRAMCDAPRIAIAAPLAARADYLTRAYTDIAADAPRLALTLEQLRHAHAREVVDGWQGMALAGEVNGLAMALIKDHYDPRYGKHRARVADARLDLTVDALDPAALSGLAQRIAEALPGLAGANLKS